MTKQNNVFLLTLIDFIGRILNIIYCVVRGRINQAGGVA